MEKWGINHIHVESAGVGVESIRSLRKKNSKISKMTRHILRHDYGIELDHKRIKHLGEVRGNWDTVLAVDNDTVEIIEEDFPEYLSKTVLAKEFADYSLSHSMEIHGPYYHQHDYRPSDWTERLGYDFMLNECKNVSRRIVKRLGGYGG
jgi:protein-tyrosine-phosphatase